MNKPQTKVEAEHLKKLSLSILVSVILLCLQTQWDYPAEPFVSGSITGYLIWAPTRYEWMLWYFQCNIESTVSLFVGGIIGARFGLSFVNKRVVSTR